MSCHVVLSLTHKLRTVHEMHMLKAIAFDGPRNQCCDNNSGKPQPIGLDLVHTGKILRSTTFRKFWTRSAKWERNGGAWTILAHPGILSMQNDILATSEQVILTRFGYDTWIYATSKIFDKFKFWGQLPPKTQNWGGQLAYLCHPIAHGTHCRVYSLHGLQSLGHQTKSSPGQVGPWTTRPHNELRSKTTQPYSNRPEVNSAQNEYNLDM